MMKSQATSMQPLANRSGIKLVRLREGIYVDGSPVEPERGVPRRVVHLLTGEMVTLDFNEGTPWEERLPAVSCCGVAFPPGTFEEVPWGTELPHKLCMATTRIPHSYIERLFLDAQEVSRRMSFDDKAHDLVSRTLQSLLGKRSDWEFVEDDGVWTYTASFSGVFTEDARFPRGRDMGLELLEISLAGGTHVRVNSCGVRDGCPKHLANIRMFSLPEDVQILNNRLASLENQATSVLLDDLLWCLFKGKCSRLTMFDPLM